MDTRRIFGNEKVFLTPEERAQSRTGAIDQFMTDMSGIPRLLQQFVAKSTPLTPGEWYNPVQGSKEALEAEDRAWYSHQASQPQPYQQARSLGTFAAVAADPLNYINPASAPVKGMARLADFALKEAATPQGRQVMKNALTNQRGMFVPPTGEELNALMKMAKGEEVKDVPWVWSELTDRMPRTEISDDAAGFTTLQQGVKSGQLSNYVDHDALFDRIPETQGIEFNRYADGSGGAYQPKVNYSDGRSGEVITSRGAEDRSSLKNTTLHELQHAIQERGNWARGGSPETALDSVQGEQRTLQSRLNELAEMGEEAIPEQREIIRRLNELEATGGAIPKMEAYRRLAGEEEARRTATRANMTMSERYGNPYKGTDIPDPRDLIVTRGGGNALSVEPLYRMTEQEIPLTALKLNDDGLATAQATFLWEKSPKISSAPVDVTMNADGTMELMNGYHRYVAAKKAGQTSIKANVRDYVKEAK